MNHVSHGENLSKPWDASNHKEAILDALSLGVTRRRREQNVRAHYAYLEKHRLDVDIPSREVSLQLLTDLAPDRKSQKIARLALEVVRNAKAVHIDTFQGYTATLIQHEDGSRRAAAYFSGTSELHKPTLLRVGEATGRSYMRDLEHTATLTALITNSASSTNVEGIGPIANEYHSSESKTGRRTDATFLVKGLPRRTAQQFVATLQEHPVEMLDGIVYTAFTGSRTDPPGRSLLQTPSTDQDTLFIPGACREVMVVGGANRARPGVPSRKRR